jgi:thioredoxin-like negative regulator of GroEL
MFTQANKAAKKNQWGKAAKLYGESILIKPSTDSLVGYAEANIYIKRQADSKTQRKQAKQRDFKYAAQVLETALQFSEKIGESGTNQNVQQRATQKLTCIKEYLQSGSVDEQCQFIQEATE